MCNYQETNSNIDRDQALRDAIDESRSADLKQHADKLIQGFVKLDDSSVKRAVWELVQNACDLSTECKVIIDYSKGSFSFSHNGKPFKSATLISLIKQVSNNDDKIENVGQFGTGFISTHVFGRKFTINSFLDVKGKFIKVRDFLVDRSATESETMVKSIQDQENDVYSLIKIGEITQETDKLTTFTYLPSSKVEHQNITESTTNLQEYIPLVLTLNKKLISVTIINKNGEEKTFKKGVKTLLNGCYITPIETDQGDTDVFSLKDDAEELEVILPLSKIDLTIPNNERVAKLFLFYPLIGTEEWGCNFIIHSKYFQPTESRDGIHLKSANEQNRQDESKNRLLINKASELIFEFVKKQGPVVKHPINLARINFNVDGEKQLLNEYFQGLKATWVEHFRQIQLVETESGRLDPSSAWFFERELLLDEESLSSIYSVVSKYWKNVPRIDLVRDWTSIIEEWKLASPQIIKIKDLIINIEKDGSLQSFENPDDLY